MNAPVDMETSVSIHYKGEMRAINSVDDVEAVIREVRKDISRGGSFPTQEQADVLAVLGGVRAMFESGGSDLSPLLSVLELIGATPVTEEFEEGDYDIQRLRADLNGGANVHCCAQCGSEAAQDEDRAGGAIHAVVHAVIPEEEGDILVEMAENVQGRYFLMPEVALSEAVDQSCPLFGVIIDNFVEFVSATSAMSDDQGTIFVEISEFPDQLPDGTYLYKLTLSFGPTPPQG